MSASPAQLRANEKYRRAHVKQKNVKFYPSEAAVLAFAEEQGPWETYVKRLIREDMKRRAGR